MWSTPPDEGTLPFRRKVRVLAIKSEPTLPRGAINDALSGKEITKRIGPGEPSGPVKAREESTIDPERGCSVSEIIWPVGVHH